MNRIVKVSNNSKYKPGDYSFPFLMGIICRITDVMADSVFVTIEHIICTASDIDGIDEAIFPEGIGEIPKGFLVSGSNEIELIIYPSDSATLHLAMQEKTARYFSIADENELTEE